MLTKKQLVIFDSLKQHNYNCAGAKISCNNPATVKGYMVCPANKYRESFVCHQKLKGIVTELVENHELEEKMKAIWS